MKKLLKIFKKKWAEYLFEILVIIIGIISAFILDNWHTQYVEHQKETVALMEISDGFTFDLIDMKFNSDGHLAAIKSAEIVKLFLTDSIPYNDSLETHFGNITHEYLFIPQNSGYESYKSLGTDLIKNRKLRNAIAKLYEFNYKYLSDLEEGTGHEFFDPTALQYYSKNFINIDSNNYFKDIHTPTYSEMQKELELFLIKPLNPDALKNDNNYIFYLNYNERMRKLIFNQYLIVRKNVMEVNSMIIEELESR